MNSRDRRVFLLGSSFELGGGTREVQQEPWVTETVAAKGWESFRISESDPNYPSRKDAKVMRTEIVASVIALKRLVNRLRLDPDDLTETPLYIATSIPAHSLEEEISRLLTSIDVQGVWGDQEKRNRLLFSRTNPMNGLKVLSNANSCFAAENCGARGNNATYGDTSNAGYLALEEAWYDVNGGQSNYAIVGVGASCGNASLLSLQGLAAGPELQMQSEAAVFLVLGNQDCLDAESNHTPIRIKHLEQTPSIPSLIRQGDGQSCSDEEADVGTLSVYSDPFGYFPATGEGKLNLTNDVGNLGAASLLCDISFAESRLASREYVTAVCRDRDVYGRETRVELEAG